MTVAELIVKLQELPGDTPVVVETYDELNGLWFDAPEVDLQADRDRVVLRATD